MIPLSKKHFQEAATAEFARIFITALPPDFLSRPVALMTCMRLSLRRAAHVVVASSAK